MLDKVNKISQHKISRVLGTFIFAVVLVVLGAAGAGYIMMQRPELVGLSKGQGQVQAEVDGLLKEISALIALPADERPTVATVTDPEKIKDQPFFKSAISGDKVLIFTNSKKAILYRPSEKRIIEVGAVNINKSQSGEVAAPVNIALYNGTTTSGLTNEAEKQLLSQVTNAKVVVKENAAKTDYSKTVIVDVNGDKAKEAEVLAKLFKGEVKTLPDGEKKPDSVLLIIVGSEFKPAQ